MSVGVGQVSTFAADEGQREWGVMQDRACASTGKHGAGTFVLCTRGGVAVGGVASHPLHDSHKGTLCGHRPQYGRVSAGGEAKRPLHSVHTTHRGWSRLASQYH